MKKSLFGTNRTVYVGSLAENRAMHMTADAEEPIENAREFFIDMVEKNVFEEHKPLLFKFLYPKKVREVFKDINQAEVDFLVEHEGGRSWDRCEVDITSRDENGDPDKFCVYIKDIDALMRQHLEEERKRAERELLENQAFDHSKIMKFTYYVTEGYYIASSGIEDLHGAPKRMDGMPGSFRDNFIDSEYHPAYDEMYARCFEGTNHVTAELKDVHGHFVHVTLEIVESDDNGKPTLILGIVENMDELHRAQKEAELMEEVCSFAVANHYEEADLINVRENTISNVIETADGNDVGFCSSSKSNSSYDDEICKLAAERACSDEDRAKVETLYLKNLVPILEEEGKHTVRCQFRTDAGGTCWKQIECIFFKDDKNRIIMLGTNVQAEEDVKEQLRSAAEEAQEANRAKSAFLANMSHEIRTPMNSIVGISEILLGKPLPEEVLMDITTIQNSGSSLLGIINDILDFSKIETGKLEINETDYMLPSLLMDVSNVISVRLSGRPIYFMMDIDPSLPNRYYGDDIRLKQILLNLIGNSAKFTKEGYIQLRVDGRFLDDRKYEMTFEIKDSGIGIREEDLGKLFTTFSQVDTKRNREISGSGLGLAISKNLAQMMGGDLAVESEYGRGSTFTVRVVQTVEKYEKIGEVRSPENVSVLICERNETIIFSLKKTLEKLGLRYDVCREVDKIRSYEGMTHVLIRRKSFPAIKEKLEFMFREENIYLILDNDEHAESHYLKYKQLQLPLICMQLINALNGEEIVTSIKKKSFDRSQIVPLTFARILIVDDNTTNLQVAQGLMAPYKMKIDVATSGFKAIEMVKTIKYDAIFMDHMMPEMDGIETTQYIRNMQGDYYRNVPIIALTANAMSDAKQMFLSSGMDDFVAKPIEMAELNRVLKKFVQSQAPEGYLAKMSEKMKKSNRQEKPAPISYGNGAAPFSSQMPLVVAEAAQPVEANGITQQLLAQNNMLLSQNMLLLRAMLGEDVSQAMPQLSYPEDEDDELEEAAGEEIAGDEFGGTDAAEAFEELRANIPGVEMQASLETYGGSVPIYHNILRTYYYDIKQREPKLKEMVEARDIENFTIFVHAIKSASFGVGANDLGEAAFELEKAGKADDWDTISKKYPEFDQALVSMIDGVGRYVTLYLEEEKDETGEREAEFPADIVRSLKKVSEDMDYLTVEELLNKLNEHRYTDELEEKLQAMLRLSEGFEYDMLDEMIQEL